MEDTELSGEILDIEWETPSQYKNEFLPEEYLRKNSVSYKLLNDTFTSVWSSDSDEDNKNKKDLSKTVTTTRKERMPGIKRRLLRLYKPFTAYPRQSHLTINQHKVYLELMKKFCKFSSHMSKNDQQEFQLYQTLQEKVAAEQAEYLDFLRNFAMSNQSRYSSVDPDVTKYINEYWKEQLKNPLKYPRYYRQYRTVGLVLNDSKDLLDLVHQAEILRRGRLNVLDLNRRFLKIERSYAKFARRHPIIDEETANKETLTTFNCPVSQDKNAEIIAQKCNVDFVVSSSGLKRICDNYPPFNKTWEIPVIVKELDVKENGHSVKKRVIFIDKALPKRRMTVVDKLLLYHKIAIKPLLVKYKPTQYPQVGPNEDPCWQNDREEDGFLQLDLSKENDHESFGVDGPSSSKEPVKMYCDNEDSVNSNKKSVSPKKVSDKISVPGENDLTEQNNNAEVSSVCMSDSDDENLVIDDPDVASATKSEHKTQKHQSPCSTNATENVSAISEMTTENELVEEANESKRHTRSMAKMLETLHKVEKITGIKTQKSGETVSATNNLQSGTLGNSEAVGTEQTSSPNEEVNGGQCDNKTTASAKDSKVKKKPYSLLDELLEEQNKWFEQEQHKSDQCHSKPFGKNVKVLLAGYKPIPPPKGSNYVYNLFSLKKKDILSHGYKLLIRCKVDCQKAPPKRKTATIVPKLEFQPEFGAEIVTISEMIQGWLSVRIRPFSALLRARINAFTSDIMMFEEKECKDFYNDERYHNMHASSCLHTLEAVLRAFSDLPPAQYIFTHEPKMGAFGNIYMATSDTRGTLYDLHEQYNVDTTANEPQVLSNAWNPIDFSIITPLHEQLGRVPGTFIPKNAKMKKKKPARKQKKADSTS